MSRVKHHVDGRAHDEPGEDVLDLVDPATGVAHGSAPVGSAASVDRAVTAAVDARASWQDRTPAERSTVLLRLADLLEQHGEELADLECRDTGKPRATWREWELAHCADVLRFSAGAARAMLGPLTADYQCGMTSTVRRVPAGVVAAVVPWNFPLMMAMWKVAPVLATGNTCVLKPAQQTPHTAVRLAEIAARAGLPPGVLNVVCGDESTGRLLVAHPGVDLVAFTGSERAGRDIAASAGALLKRTHLELGGKAPAVVLADLADDQSGLDRCVRGIAGAAFFNSGQSCTAATRVIVVGDGYEEVVERLGEVASKTTCGPLISAAHRDRVHGFVARRGAHTRLVTGGEFVAGPGFHYEPTVVADVRDGDELCDEEVFGPVLTVQRADDEEHAVRSANATRYGLAASVWTGDHAAAMRVVRRLEAGDIWVNTHGFQATEMPHGGRGASGHGSDLSVQSLLEYTRPVHVASVWE